MGQSLDPRLELLGAFLVVEPVKPGSQASSSWGRGRATAVGIGILAAEASYWWHRAPGGVPNIVPVKPSGLELQPASVELMGRGGATAGGVGSSRRRRAPGAR